MVCVAIRGEASAGLRSEVESFHWCGVAKLGRMIRILRQAGVEKVVWAGKIHKVAMYAPWRLLRYIPDLLGYRLFYGMLKDKKDDTILGAVARVFGEHGLEVVSQVEYCPRILAREGPMTAGAISEAERKDITFGWHLAKEMGRLDVGQSVLVKEQSVLAVEAVEGTDACILRAGELCPQGGFTLVKVAKPKQDLRFDMPAIGPTTVRNLALAGGSILAVEAGHTLVIEVERTIETAERLGVRIFGVHPDRIEA